MQRGFQPLSLCRPEFSPGLLWFLLIQRATWTAPPLAEAALRLCEVAVLWDPWVLFAPWPAAMRLDFWSSAECYLRARLQPMGQDSGHLPRKPSPAWHTCAGNECSLEGPGACPSHPAQLLGLLQDCAREVGVSELIRFLRFQRSPNPVS